MDKKSGLMLVFLTAIISGFSIFINKFGVGGINSNIFTFLKNIIVVIFIFSLILISKEFNTLRNLTKKDWLKLITIGFFGGSIPFLLFFKGLQLTSSASASLIHKTMFVFVIIFAFVFLKEKLNKNILIAAILLLAGNFLLLKIKFFTFNFGDFLILTATVFWAVENLISKHVLRNLTGNTVAFGRMFFGSLFILLFLMFTRQFNLIFSLSANQALWILVSSIFLLLYVFTWYNGLKYVRVTVATCILLLGSIITTALNYIFADTVITLAQAFGMLLILAGIIFAVGFSQTIDLAKSVLRWKHTN